MWIPMNFWPPLMHGGFRNIPGKRSYLGLALISSRSSDGLFVRTIESSMSQERGSAPGSILQHTVVTWILQRLLLAWRQQSRRHSNAANRMGERLSHSTISNTSKLFIYASQLSSPSKNEEVMQLSIENIFLFHIKSR